MSTDMDAAAMHAGADGDYDAAASAATDAADVPPQPTLFLDALPYLDQQDPQTAEQVQSLLNEGASQQRVQMQADVCCMCVSACAVLCKRAAAADCAALPLSVRLCLPCAVPVAEMSALTRTPDDYLNDFLKLRGYQQDYLKFVGITG